MLWLKRILWLAAWCVWLWLGFGLYREFPRDLGPVVCNLNLALNENVIGFVGDEPKIVSHIDRWVVFRDARTGRILRRTEVGDGRFQTSPDVRWLIGNEWSWKANKLIEQYLVDLSTGERRRFPLQGVHVSQFHRTKPWVLMYSHANDDHDARVAVVDLPDNRVLFQWDGTGVRKDKKELAGPPCFLDADRVVIPIHGREDAEGDRPREKDGLEIWSVASPSGPATIVDGVAFRFGMGASSNGRVAGYVEREDWGLEVWDLSAGERVFREPQSAKQGWIAHAPSLSDDGRIVTAPYRSHRYDVDTGRPIAVSAAPGHRWSDHADRTEKYEGASLKFGRWYELPKTFAVHDLETGKFLHRTWEPALRFERIVEGSHLAIVGGEVREMPPRVDWLLLIICQTILALPLVLLWVVLRWRQRRAARP